MRMTPIDHIEYKCTDEKRNFSGLFPGISRLYPYFDCFCCRSNCKCSKKPSQGLVSANVAGWSAVGQDGSED